MKNLSIHKKSSIMKKMKKSRRVVGAAIALAAAIVVTGCSKSPNNNAQQSADAQQSAAAAPEVEGISAPIPQDQVGARYAVSAEPVLFKNGEILKVVVNVTNTGKVAVNSKGKMPVNLAVSLVDGAGAMVKQEFVRVPLPPQGIPAGGSADVVAEVPAQAVAGNTLRFGLVQEAVAWYSDYKIQPLDYGPFNSCKDQGKPTLCGKDGKPLTMQ
ncbi:glycosyltransferase [Xanthomonas fragariae]|uniref:Membrane protein WxcE n=1 Tax=Xanthomonas fragariae TaxID=48664 RepID=A0A1Y6H4I3_9XANT|nr:hypothetical protein [Xanthomonas fragariae]AOD15872.1 glycosyltransferase [Xanthomonas fragariae]AOD19293.1 glycosyltransferase [Xanthomonas fragariae]ENZ93736.1 hypothetical protein O1K_19036 [Xanthomonas fragariae LMG 25863]MBL9198231.1 glycosyltransferase [Xanthomonas fragariae]MBL9221123.1 glycosyltransferase [Xanthomonas fragariae]